MRTYPAFIVMTAADLRGFTFAADREYFSKPVAVEVTETDRGLIATDHRRGHTYPVDRKSLKSKFHLTRRQCQAAGIEP